MWIFFLLLFLLLLSSKRFVKFLFRVVLWSLDMGSTMIKLTIFIISLICLCFSETLLIGIAALVLMCYVYP
jgi:hypothetical protein